MNNTACLRDLTVHDGQAHLGPGQAGVDLRLGKSQGLPRGQEIRTHGNEDPAIVPILLSWTVLCRVSETPLGKIEFLFLLVLLLQVAQQDAQVPTAVSMKRVIGLDFSILHINHKQSPVNILLVARNKNVVQGEDVMSLQELTLS